MSRPIFGLLLACLICQPALSADLGVRARQVHRHHIVLPPERHVIEVVHPPGGGRFLINGTTFTAATPACLGWTAGDRIRLRAGDWHGRCVAATFYNVTRHRSCEMLCG